MAEGAEQRPSLLLLPATGRAQTSRAEVKEKFTTFAKAQGFTEDTIVFLPQMGEAASLMGKRLGRIRGRPSPEGRPGWSSPAHMSTEQHVASRGGQSVLTG